MRSTVTIVAAALSLLVSFLPGRLQNAEQDPSATPPLAEAIIGDWRGFLVFNNLRADSTRIPAHLRFTRYGIVFYDRDELPLFPALRDWRADYEVVGTAIYMNPHRVSPRFQSHPPVVFSGVVVTGNQLEAVIVPYGGEVEGKPFGEFTAFAVALTMHRE